MSQLQDRMRGRAQPPQRFCSACDGQAAEIKALECGCKVPGCTNTWIWSGRDQLASESSMPPERMCETCYQQWKALEDRAMPCQVKSCQGTFLWGRMAQLDAQLAGRVEAPRRFCNDCYEKFKGLEDRVVPCRIAECDGTWVWSRMAQLEVLVKDGSTEPPQRMCPRCSSELSDAEDLTHPCRIPGCTGTGMERRSAVFARSKSQASAPRRMCDACSARMDELGDEEIPCRYARYGCTGVFVWKRESRLRAEKSGRNVAPPKKACPDCEAALARGGQSSTVTCGGCGAFIMQLSEDDLIQIHLKHRSAPEALCQTCRSGQKTN
jgi:hypothetical protein